MPSELSQDSLPASYCYYDSILNNSQLLVSKEIKEFFKFKNKFRFAFLRNEDFKQRLCEKLGLVETTEVSTETGKMTFKHRCVNKKEQNQINHHSSHHSVALQKSNYIIIDDDLGRIQQQFNL